MATYECKRCCGTGKVGNFLNVKGGVCFSCNGSGKKRAMKTIVVQEQRGRLAYPDGDKGGWMSVSCAEMLAAKDSTLVVEYTTIDVKKRVAK